MYFVVGNPVRYTDPTGHNICDEDGNCYNQGKPVGSEKKPPITPPPLRTPLQDVIFNDMADESDIAFNFPLDGCYARKHLMNKRIQERYKNVKVENVWAFGTPAAPLTVTTNGPYGTVEWRYHVATLITVTDANGNSSQWVIDPSIADRPLTIDEWANTMNASVSQTSTTAVGDPAPGYSIGSGYVPGADPYFGPFTTSEAMVDAHAAYTMERYLACGNAGSGCGLR